MSAKKAQIKTEASQRARKSMICDFCHAPLVRGMKGEHFKMYHPQFRFSLVPRPNTSGNDIVCDVCHIRLESYGELVRDHLHEAIEASEGGEAQPGESGKIDNTLTTLERFFDGLDRLYRRAILCDKYEALCEKYAAQIVDLENALQRQKD